LPLIVLNVVIHVLGLGLIHERVVRDLAGALDRRHFTVVFTVVMGATALLATILHGIEGTIWAAAYRPLGAFPRQQVRHALFAQRNNILRPREPLSGTALADDGALEALNGMLLFGLTTAFLFAMIQEVWPIGNRARRRHP
jgi:hypothetical protein